MFRRVIIAISTLALLFSVAGTAFALSSRTAIPGQGPGVGDNHAYNTIVHVCVMNEGAYFEQHTNPETIGNCAAGWTQAELNQPYLPISPGSFVLSLNVPVPNSSSFTQTNYVCTDVQNSQGPNGTDPNVITNMECTQTANLTK